MRRFKRLAAFETEGCPELEGLYEAAATFAASVNYTEPYWLTLCGPSGIGKTHLAEVVKRQFMEQNRFDKVYNRAENRLEGGTMLWVDWRGLCSDLRTGNPARLLEELCEEWFIILDDIGSEYDKSGYVAAALDRLLNTRRDRWTLITTNLFLKDVAEKLDPRMADRMVRGRNVVVECRASSYAVRRMQ